MTEQLTVKVAVKIMGFADRDQIDADSLKKQYKMLALKHHPDKGGRAETFRKINAANEYLKKEIEMTGPFKFLQNKPVTMNANPRKEPRFTPQYSPQEEMNNTFRKFRGPNALSPIDLKPTLTPRPKFAPRSTQEELDDTFRKYRSPKPHAPQPSPRFIVNNPILWMSQYHFLMSMELIFLIILLQKRQSLLAQNQKSIEQEYSRYLQYTHAN